MKRRQQEHDDLPFHNVFRCSHPDCVMDVSQIVSGAVIVQPGDTLIVALSGYGTPESHQKVLDHFEANLANTITVTVLDGVQALAVVKGGA